MVDSQAIALEVATPETASLLANLLEL